MDGVAGGRRALPEPGRSAAIFLRKAEAAAEKSQNQEAKMPPAVAKTAQMGRAVPAIGGQRGGHLAHDLLVEAGLDHHFAGELHARGCQLEPFVSLFAKTAQ